ncbi:DNA-binding transcriptional LysR family regulator [Catenulispora sp. GAS73]|uniref:LysR family transcriptional regulator n=1 Tax=Catenulispora sp. GAS73 TaxID=3156269 RepID=UPI003518273D
MELRQLKVFVAVADESSFTRAAARLNMVQSAVSVAVRNLEKQLGVRLLERTTHHVDLTQAGRLFLPEARRTLAAAQEARHLVEQLHDGLRGEIRLGLVQAPKQMVVHPAHLVARFRAAFPGVTVSVRSGGSVQHAEDLRRGRLDIAFVTLSSEATSGLDLYVLRSEALQLLCSADHPLAGRDQVRLAELVDEPFVETPTTWGNRLASDAAFARLGLSRRVEYEIGDVSGFISFVQQGLGIALAPMSFIGHDEGLRAVPLGPDAPSLSVSLAVPADQTVSTPTKALLQAAREMHEAAKNEAAKSEPAKPGSQSAES